MRVVWTLVQANPGSPSTEIGGRSPGDRFRVPQLNERSSDASRLDTRARKSWVSIHRNRGAIARILASILACGRGRHWDKTSINRRVAAKKGAISRIEGASSGLEWKSPAARRPAGAKHWVERGGESWNQAVFCGQAIRERGVIARAHEPPAIVAELLSQGRHGETSEHDARRSTERGVNARIPWRSPACGQKRGGDRPNGRLSHRGRGQCPQSASSSPAQQWTASAGQEAWTAEGCSRLAPRRAGRPDRRREPAREPSGRSS
jgi:hypothetical protein